MKIRTGFVSNSSSSSFVCCLTGESESGMDMGLSDSGMVACQNGHVFIEDLQLDSDNKPTIKDYRGQFEHWCNEYSWRKESLTKLELSDEDFLEFIENEMLEEFEEDGINPLYCPVCQFKDLPWEDVAKWFLVQYKASRREFAASMVNQYKNYNEFVNVLKGVKK